MDLIKHSKKIWLGNQYTLTLICGYIKWLRIGVILKGKVVVVAKALWEIYQRNGAPHRIVADNGNEL